MDSQISTPFRAIIVGGGPAGLAMANCLQAAGIDYAVFERRPEVVEPSGAGLGIWPQGVRILSQLGLLDTAETIGSSMSMSYHLDPNGKHMFATPFFDGLRESTGFPFLMFERMRFLDMLYGHIKDKPKINVSKRVAGIEQDSTGVLVTFEDGSTESGDIVIGADGVHSFVRTQVLGDEATNSALISNYKCLFGMSPRPKVSRVGDMVDTHDSKFSFLTLAHQDYLFWFVFIKLDRPISEPTFYSDRDAEILAEQYLDHPVDSKLVFRELWETRTRSKLANVEEGVQPTWHKGRIVLLGDSAHKMTPNIAFGFNNAFESAVSLTNHLRNALMAASSDTTFLDSAAIEQAFLAYQNQRFARASAFVRRTSFYTRLCAWETPLLKWMVILWPFLISGKTLVNRSVKTVVGAVKLDFLEVLDKRRGIVKFHDEIEASRKSSGSAGGFGRVLLLLVFLVGGISTGAYMLFAESNGVA